MDEDQEWASWRAWLGHEPSGKNIYAQVVEMLAWRQIWDSFATIHDAAPEAARRNATFLQWTKFNYARSQGLAIRRQADARSDVVSLARLIDRIWKYPTILSLERGWKAKSGRRWQFLNRLAGTPAAKRIAIKLKTPKVFCHKCCNGGWMSLEETAVKPMEPGPRGNEYEGRTRFDGGRRGTSPAEDSSTRARADRG